MKNKNNLRVRTGKLLFICIFVLVGYTAVYALGCPSEKQSVEAKYNSEQTPIRLTLRTSKRIYHVGEAIQVTVLLENMSPDKFYYIGRNLYQGDIPTPFHYIDFTFSDDAGKPLRLFEGASVEDPIRTYGPDGKPIPPTRLTITELLMREYILLSPGAVYGFRMEFYRPGSKPGRYRFSAAYHEIEALNRMEAELKGLSVPVWTQLLVSNTATIAVIP